VVALELPQRLGAVVLRQVHFDQSGTRALTQRIHPHRGEGGLSGIAIPAGDCEQSSKRLQSVQAKLPPVLGLEEDPVLIPVGQQLLREGSDCRSTEIRGVEGLIGSLQEAVGEQLCLAEVDLDAARESEVAWIYLHRIANSAVEPRESGAQAGVSAALARVGPEGTGYQQTFNRAAMDGQEGEQALRAFNKYDLCVPIDKLEAAHQQDS
jgi:hypothetical protein